MNDLEKLFIVYSPIFAALASLRPRSGHALREIFRVSLVALPARTLAMVINRISYQQRETLH
jgi:hypothetical protein